MWRSRAVTFTCVVLFVLPLAAQQPPPPPRKDVTAVKVDGKAPELDGRLDEPVWTTAQPATGFILREPTEGSPAPERTEVRFAYTQEALYVGARMFSNAPGSIKRLVARRDREPPSERLIVSLDTRADRRTAYSFGITPGGVRIDYFHGSDFEDARDYSYDPVWEAHTAVDSLGWVAEIRIPFTQLRYNPGREQVWGVNLVRLVPERNEQSFWILVGRDETGWSSRMGRLAGIADLPPSRRIELSPYVATNGRRFGEVDSANPFAERFATSARLGGDLKMGLGPNITLEATFNPDFGQVEADPAEVNLTAFETFFEERRPFFLEGSDLLGGRGTFYSRRIGSQPPGSANAEYSEEADNSTILGAAKVTGRLPSGLAIGGLAAVTARERIATFTDTAGGTFGTAIVAPPTVYGIVTARQEFGRDRSTFAASFSAVERDLEPGSPLEDLVARRAFTGLVDTRIRWGGGKYDMSAYFGVSHVKGDSAAILRLQRSSRRYFQRPDADHVDVDSGRTSLTGVTAGINHSKLAGNLRWDIDYIEERPSLELNDIGSLGSTDDRGLFWDMWYRRTRPGPVLHSWTAGFFQGNEWNFDGNRKFTEAGVWWDGTLKGSFLRPSFQISTRLRALSDDQTRGGPLMATPSNWSLDLGLAGRRGARTGWGLEVTFAGNELDGKVFEGEASLSARPGTQWELSLEGRYRRETVARQYAFTDTVGSNPNTYGDHYIFAFVERSEIALKFRAALAIRPNLTLEAYLEPFASSGRYRDPGELVAARSMELAPVASFGSARDFDVRSLRSNLVLRWEWAPGSTLFVVWQQDRGSFGIPTQNVGPRGLLDAFDTPGDHFFAIKVNYWLAVR